MPETEAGLSLRHCSFPVIDYFLKTSIAEQRKLSRVDPLKICLLFLIRVIILDHFVQSFDIREFHCYLLSARFQRSIRQNRY